MSNDDKSSDFILSLIKGAFGTAIGITGAVATSQTLGATLLIPVAVEAFNVLIPNQRLDRVEKLLKILASKICHLSEAQVKQRFHTPEFLDIFEDCVNLVIRSVSDDEIKYLASVLEKSLTDEEINHLKKKRLLSILAKLNDIEIIILESYGFSNQGDSEFRKKHKFLIQGIEISNDSSEEEKENHAMYTNYRNNLVNLGLIGSHRSGSGATYSTQLGNMLLKLIGCTQISEEVIGIPLNPLNAIHNITEGLHDLDKDLKARTKPKVDSTRETENQKARKTIEQLVKGIKYM